MNLATTIKLQAGGPGSGCKGSNCGRPQSNTYSTLKGTDERFHKEITWDASEIYSDKRNETPLLGKKLIKDEILYHGHKLEPDYGLGTPQMYKNGKKFAVTFLTRNKQTAEWYAYGDNEIKYKGVVYKVEVPKGTLVYEDPDPDPKYSGGVFVDRKDIKLKNKL